LKDFKINPIKSLSTIRLNSNFLIFLICSGFVGHLLCYDYYSDDGFIALRYAKNFVKGHGLVFNPGVKVEGYTSLLWVLLLFSGAKLGIDLVFLSRILGLIFSICTLVLTFHLSKLLSTNSKSSLWNLLAPILMASSGSFACWGAAGLETSLFTFMFSLSFYTVFKKKYLLAALLTGLLVISRPEGNLFALLLGTYVLYVTRHENKKIWIQWLSIGALFLTAPFVFRYFYYGDWLPNTYYAKSGDLTTQLSMGWQYLIDFGADHESLVVLLFVLLFFLIKGNNHLRFLSFTSIIWISVVVWEGGDGLPMYRFFIPILPFIFCLYTAFFQLSLTTLNQRSTKFPWIFLIFSLIGLLLWVHSSVPTKHYRYQNYHYQKNIEIPLWISVGKWFHKNAKKGETIATVPIGAISYYSEMVIYDMLGLTDKHIAHIKPSKKETFWAGHLKHDGQYILNLKPTYLLLGNIDITSKPRDPNKKPFIPFKTGAIALREQDMFLTDTIEKMYRPKTVMIQPGLFLNFYQLVASSKEKTTNL